MTKAGVLHRTWLCVLALALTACGGGAVADREMTATWTAGDDEALGVTPPVAPSAEVPSAELSSVDQ